ncbi:hypothetical protein H0K60_004484 [Salmonella enterica]|nr:hypothetical protein [Salmonella enterica]EFR2649727.1 hypothetical protein [Salmonella enterica]EFS1408076.1 hypothetical protein [Salmonella enterica]EHQ8162524.1 hypothetical protein [Salmonella enterica]EJZ9218177.1 hypothetical protein [Salmonella enterica]
MAAEALSGLFYLLSKLGIHCPMMCQIQHEYTLPKPANPFSDMLTIQSSPGLSKCDTGAITVSERDQIVDDAIAVICGIIAEGGSWRDVEEAPEVKAAVILGFDLGYIKDAWM